MRKGERVQISMAYEKAVTDQTEKYMVVDRDDRDDSKGPPWTALKAMAERFLC